MIYVQDERGQQLFSKMGTLKGYTSSTLSYQSGNMKYTCDEKGRNLYSTFADTPKPPPKIHQRNSQSTTDSSAEIPLPIIILAVILFSIYGLKKKYWDHEEAVSAPIVTQHAAEPAQAPTSSDDMPTTGDPSTKLAGKDEQAPPTIVSREATSTRQLTSEDNIKSEKGPADILIANASVLNLNDPKISKSIQKALDKGRAIAWSSSGHHGYAVPSAVTQSADRSCRTLFVTIFDGDVQSQSEAKTYCLLANNEGWQLSQP